MSPSCPEENRISPERGLGMVEARAGNRLAHPHPFGGLHYGPRRSTLYDAHKRHSATPSGLGTFGIALQHIRSWGRDR
jgi:hypothetical protein